MLTTIHLPNEEANEAETQSTSVARIETTYDDDVSVSSDKESITIDYATDEQLSSSDEHSSHETKEPASPQQEYVDIEDPQTGTVDSDEDVSIPLIVPGCSFEDSPPEMDEPTRKAKTPGKAKTIVMNAAKTTGKVAKVTAKEIEKAAKTTEKVAKRTGKEIAKAAKTTAKGTEKVFRKTADVATSLPHKAGNHWSHNLGIILVIAVGPVILSMVSLLIKLRSVNAGLSANRVFLYGGHTIVEIFTLLPFIMTCHYAIPDAEIPFKSRLISLLFGLGVGKLLLAFIAEAWWSPGADPVFPVPFSFLVAMFASVPSSLWMLWLLTPMRTAKHNPVGCQRIQEKFRLCFLLLGCKMLSLLFACFWAVGFRQLTNWPVLQPLAILGLTLLEFVAKILAGGHLTTRLNALRWLQLNLVLDLIFASVQTSTLPYFSNYISVGISVAGTMLALAWRAYSGVDRFQYFLADLLRILRAERGEVQGGKVKGIGGVLKEKVISPVKEATMASQLNLFGNGAGAKRNDKFEKEAGEEPADIEAQEIQRSETAETFENSFSTTASEDPSDEPKIERREAYKNGKIIYNRNSGLHEVSGDQRRLFHVVDGVSSAVVVSVVRLAAILQSALTRHLPIKEHINTSFQISDEQWLDATIYCLIYLVGVGIVILFVGAYLRRGADLGGLTLNRIISFTFRDSFWFFFFWFCFTCNLLEALQITHFGADFSLKFAWLACRETGQMAWPLCVSNMSL